MAQSAGFPHDSALIILPYSDVFLIGISVKLEVWDLRFVPAGAFFQPLRLTPYETFAFTSRYARPFRDRDTAVARGRPDHYRGFVPLAGTQPDSAPPRAPVAAQAHAAAAALCFRADGGELRQGQHPHYRPGGGHGGGSGILQPQINPARRGLRVPRPQGGPPPQISHG